MGEGYGGTFTRKSELEGEKSSCRKSADHVSRSRTPLSWSVYINRAIGNETALRFFEPMEPPKLISIQRQAEEEEEETLQTKEESGNTPEPTPDV
ncbi:MAG TPA: hypothetical protein DCZ04_06965, partial [Syntrophorhabdus aromaticivorans]|nr:hypothetical protein [Syntrophorhabdus aromaticivorans]